MDFRLFFLIDGSRGALCNGYRNIKHACSSKLSLLIVLSSSILVLLGIEVYGFSVIVLLGLNGVNCDFM